MAQTTLDAEVKTRVSPDQKAKLEKIAQGRHLKLSDILREAIREKIDRTDTEVAEAAK